MDILEQTKKTVSHPKLNTLIFGGSAAVMTASMIAGFISYAGIPSNSEAPGIKRLLLITSLLSLASAVLQGIGAYAVRHISDTLRIVSLAVSGILMLTVAIMFTMVLTELNKVGSNGTKYRDMYPTTYRAALLSTVLTFSALVIIGLTLTVAFFTIGKGKTITAPQPSTPISLAPSYTSPSGAAEQLRQLQVSASA